MACHDLPACTIERLVLHTDVPNASMQTQKSYTQVSSNASHLLEAVKMVCRCESALQGRTRLRKAQHTRLPDLFRPTRLWSA